LKPEELECCAALLRGRRWAALATAGAEGPLASMVAFAPDPAWRGVLLHLSTLALHTRNLAASERASLVVSAADDGRGDPQELARLTLSGAATGIAPSAADYGVSRDAYVDRFPAAEARFAFADFHLYRLVPERVHFVGGFARARTLPGASFLTRLKADRSL